MILRDGADRPPHRPRTGALSKEAFIFTTDHNELAVLIAADDNLTFIEASATS
jgi:hypothetical protein